MRREATVKEFAEMLLSLPEPILTKSIHYIDVSFVSKDELEEFKKHLEEQLNNTMIMLGN